MDKSGSGNDKPVATGGKIRGDWIVPFHDNGYTKSMIALAALQGRLITEACLIPSDVWHTSPDRDCPECKRISNGK